MNTVEFQHVSKRQKDFTIDNLSFTVPEGYITGFIGPNGSGKTTTIQMMMDILQMNKGDIKIFGNSHKDPINKQRIGFVYDDLFMYEDFTIQNMKAFIAPIYNSWNEDLYQKYLDKFDLPLRKKIKHFSKGMKMKTSLLFALCHNPEFIIMDEPTSGLDPIFRRELLELLQELMVDEHRTIFLSTHITNDLDQIADFIIFINHGKIRFQKSMEEVKETFHIVKGSKELIDNDTKNLFIGIQLSDTGFQALYEGNINAFESIRDQLTIEQASLEDIMFFTTRK
jgi:ABC-2 type transport system ATP-binding protein